jgi:ribosomal protein S18 acetylase RimI-like enzyme
VLLRDGQLIGCGGVNYKENQAWISWDMIDPRYHGQGFGKLLLNFRLQKIRERNQEKTIRVRTSQHAFRFYLKLGFYLTEIREDYWSQAIHLYDMRQHLP